LDLAVTHLGATKLKNITEPMRVYSLEVGSPAKAAPRAPRTARISSFGVRLIGGLLVLAMLVGGIWFLLNGGRVRDGAGSMPMSPARLSIVVLPFGNLSG